MPSTTPTRTLPIVRALMRIPVPWVFVLGYLLGVGLQLTMLPPLHLSGSASRNISMVGGALFAVGAVIAGWGLILFHSARTTTTPGETSNALVRRGPYKFTRNPMYVGLTLAYLGEMGFLVQSAPIIPLFLVVAYVNWIVIPVEESRLRETFGETYVEYRNRVRRWL